MMNAAANLPDLLELPPDLYAKARQIPDLPQRLLRFIRQEVAMEEHRRRQHSPQALALVEEAYELAAKRKAQGTDRATAMKEFSENYEGIMRTLRREEASKAL